MAAELSFHNVGVEISGKRLLQDVSMRVAEGEFVALLGPNGAGKTTLIRAALGLLPASGEVLLNGRPARQFGGRERAGILAWLPQQALVTEALSVLDLVAGARFRFRESRSNAESAARDALRQAGAEAFADRIMSTLSGGEQQRVAVAALLAQEAPLLLLDEPANHLDPAHQVSLYRLFGELWRAGRGVLCISHDVNLLSHVGDAAAVRVVGLAQGHVRFETPYTDPELPGKLGEIFGMHFESVQAGSRRMLLPGVGA